MLKLKAVHVLKLEKVIIKFLLLLYGTQYLMSSRFFFLFSVWLQVFLTVRCSEDKICSFVREFSMVLIMVILNSKITSLVRRWGFFFVWIFFFNFYRWETEALL